MNILAVDDEAAVLNNFMEVVQSVFPDAAIHGEKKGADALKFVSELKEKQENLSYAFLDVKMRGMTGIELGKRIKEIYPDIKIIFCTGYSEYACDSYQMHAIGYLLKPVTAEMIIEVLNIMDKNWDKLEEEQSEKIFVQTFGKFEVYVNGTPIIFEREKAREVLAYLVDRRGGNVTVNELIEALWEERDFDRKAKNEVYTILSSLRKSLKDAEIGYIYKKWFKYISVDMSKLNCDFLELERGNVMAMNAYKGNYLEDYSWAEYTNGRLNSLKIK